MPLFIVLHIYTAVYQFTSMLVTSGQRSGFLWLRGLSLFTVFTTCIFYLNLSLQFKSVGCKHHHIISIGQHRWSHVFLKHIIRVFGLQNINIMFKIGCFGMCLTKEPINLQLDERVNNCIMVVQWWKRQLLESEVQLAKHIDADFQRVNTLFLSHTHAGLCWGGGVGEGTVSLIIDMQHSNILSCSIYRSSVFGGNVILWLLTTGYKMNSEQHSDTHRVTHCYRPPWPLVRVYYLKADFAYVCVVSNGCCNVTDR